MSSSVNPALVSYWVSRTVYHIPPCHIAQDKATGNVSLTLQASVVLDGKGGEGGGISWGSESLKAGLKVKGTIAAVKDFGVFIQIHDSEVRNAIGHNTRG